MYPRQAKDGDKSAEAVPLVDGPKGDVNMWKTVEKAMEDQTLEDLRESREGVTIPGAPARSQPKAAKKGGKSNKTEESKEKTSGAGAGARGDEDEDSDDGFFA